MAEFPELGLISTRRELLQRLGADPTQAAELKVAMDALEYVKLARAEADSGGDDEQTFTFAHRRFQEYFATSVVLRGPHEVSSRRLLTDDRWRETAVTILQTQPPSSVRPLLAEATRLLESSSASARSRPHAGEFGWPTGCLHLLGILDNGLVARSDLDTAELRRLAGDVLLDAWQHGAWWDRKWVLDVVGATSSSGPGATSCSMPNSASPGRPWPHTPWCGRRARSSRFERAAGSTGAVGPGCRVLPRGASCGRQAPSGGFTSRAVIAIGLVTAVPTTTA